MPDNKRKRGKPDRIRIAKNQNYEVNYFVRKYYGSKVYPSDVRRIITKYGNDREVVHAKLMHLSYKRKMADYVKWMKRRKTSKRKKR